MRRRALMLSAAAVLAGMALPALGDADPSAASSTIELDVRRSKGADYPIFTVTAGMTVNAPMERAWQVLTDYDRLADVVPNLTSSRLIARDGRRCVVSQEGFGRFLFIKQAIHLLVRVEETPPSAIAVTLVKGNMHEYRADWALNAIDANTTRIDYSATIAPMFYVPSLFGAALMKSDLRAMLAAVAREMASPK